MAPRRPRRERRFAALSSALRLATAITVPMLAVFTGCAPSAPQTGWLDASGSSAVPVSEISLHAGSELRVLVELPSGYVPAELTQRAVLTIGDSVQADEQLPAAGVPADGTPAAADSFASGSIDFALRDAGRAEAGESAEESQGTLALSLGFCEPDAKDVCYFDLPSLPVRVTRTPDAAGQNVGLIHLIYRPEAPQ